MPAKALHSLNRSALMRMTGSDEAGIAIEKRRACLIYSMDLLHLVTAAVAFLGTIIKRWHQKQMAHVLWQPRRLEVASRRHHVAGVGETRRTFRHDGRRRASAHRNVPPRDAARRNPSLRNAGDLTTRARVSPTPPDPPVHAGGPYFGGCKSP
jgi:hypothetical protein